MLSVDYEDIGKIQQLNIWNLLKGLEDFVSLDISVVSTGYVIWYKGQLETGYISLDSEDEGDRRDEFRKYMLELFAGRTFKYAVIEDVIGGVNFEVNKALYQLNCIVDDMMRYGLLPKAEILRVDNKKWKMYLRNLSGAKPPIKKLKDKEEIRFHLKALRFESECQDICDAMGMGVSTIYAHKYGKLVTKKKKKLACNIDRGYNLYVCKTPEEQANKVLKYESKTGYTPITIVDKDITSNLQREFRAWVRKKGEDEYVFSITVAPEKLGDLAFDERFDLTADKVYFVAVKKVR